MKKDEKVQYILNLKKASEDASCERRKAWKELWLLFQNKQDSTDKKKWQSQIFIPKISMVIEQATTIVKRAVMSTRKLFKMDIEKEARINVKGLEEAFKERLGRSNFADAFSESVKSSFLLGFGAVKCLWDGGLSYRNVDVTDLFIDPDWVPNADERPKYFIEYKEMDYAKLLSMAKRINRQAGRNVYNMAEINKIKEDYSNYEKESERINRLGLNPYNKVDKRVQILEYWGDIIEKGRNTKPKLIPNQLVVMANEKYIIRQQDNPFGHGRSPYVTIIPSVYPHRGISGISLVEPVVRLQYAYNNVMNLAIDNLNFSVNKVFEYNAVNITNPRTLTQLYPGKMVSKTGSGPALQEVRTTQVAQDVFQMLDLIRNEIEKGTAVTEFLLGTSGKAKTATEAELKTAQAQGLFNTIARDLETNSIKPLIEMGYALSVQFDDFPDIPIEFKVGGLSLILVQREQKESIGQLLGIALQSETLASMTNIKVLWQKLLSLYEQDDAFEEGQPLRPDQRIGIGQQGADRARDEVSKMSDEQILQKAQQLGI
jgi:hypothetical protein